ncbi:hypothetical protein BZG36_02077 [Bifiguratus adelaidae]|uniref:Methyltransferase domain-containing protein n=1 Tax=Bifiguratus adelaidae TaxID=1938954 RepID=A0A261Y358_9FUNG|nr:hypothetical protein BZG36_02077 [Bifiguratus adelaidae]
MDSNSVHLLEQQLFLTFIKGLLDSKHVSSTHTEKLQVLEVGCGHAYFFELLTSQFSNRLSVTGIDRHKEGIDAGEKRLGTRLGDHRLIQSSFLDFEPQQKEAYDVIIFTKSLHHCPPLDVTIERVYNLLKPHGLLIAEEIARIPTGETWLFDRMEILYAADLLKSNRPHQLEQVIKSSDKPPMERWAMLFGHHGHDHQHEPLATMEDILISINAKFGASNVRQHGNLPFYYHFFAFAGLTDTPLGANILTTLIAQEDKAIRDGKLTGQGIIVVAEKL